MCVCIYTNTWLISYWPSDPHIGPSPQGDGQYEGHRANMRANMKLTMHYSI